MSRPQARQAPLFAVCYDVASDRERHRVDKLLAGFGFRVQKSVYECRLTPGALRQLQSRALSLGLQTGHMRLYRISGPSGAQILGVPPDETDQAFAFSISEAALPKSRARTAKGKG